MRLHTPPFVAKLLALAAAVLLPAASDAKAQTGQTIAIPEAVACPRCRIEHRLVATLTADSPDGEIAELPSALRIDPRGNYWLLGDRALPRIYAPDGRFLRTFGRLGQGPGELLGADDVFWPSRDTMVVFDSGNARATIYADDTLYARQVRTQGMIGRSMVRAWPSGVLVTGEMRAPGAESRWLHVVDLSGADARVAQSVGPAVAWRGMGSPLQYFDTSASGLVLSAGRAPYQIQRYRADGSLHSSLRRVAGWFPDTATGRIGTPQTPPSPAVTALDVADDGLLWVFVRVPAATWREGWPKLAPGQREVMTSQIDYGLMFNTRVEVMDVVRRRVLARVDLPGYAFASLGNGRVAVYANDPDGMPSVRIQELRLMGQHRR